MNSHNKNMHRLYSESSSHIEVLQTKNVITYNI